MSSTYSLLLFAVVATEVLILLVYQHNSSAKIQQLKYQYGLEAMKLEKRIGSLKQSIQQYHDKIDKVRLDIEECSAEQQS